MTLTPEIIEKIVYQFYVKATQDVWIGFHFRHIQNFDEHIPHIAVFWRQILLKEKTQTHQPFNLIKTHQPLGINKGQLRRWVVLFEQNLADFQRQGDITQQDTLLWMNFVKSIENQFLKHLKTGLL